MEKRALIIGANGGFGLAVASALKRRGWRVDGVARKTDGPRGPYDSIMAGDSLRAESIMIAARGHALLVHAVNPPYHNWDEQALPMLRATIAAAKAANAAILFPGNIYNFGPDAGENLIETAPQNPLTRKGKIRVAMERELAAAASDGVRSIVLRCGDFFGPTERGSWFGQGLLKNKPGLPKSLAYPGEPALGHSWAYLPDVGETAARLVETGIEPGFCAYHFPGHFVAPGSRMTDAISRAVGKTLPVSRTPWLLFRLIAPFVPIVRELMEMRYLWLTPHRLVGGKLATRIGAIPQTPLDEAVAAALKARMGKSAAGIGIAQPAEIGGR